MSKKRTVREALQHVADYPQPVTDETILMHTGELIARTLFDIANKPNVQTRGSLSRANKARRLIMDRLDGRRKAGSQPRQPESPDLKLHDLTGNEVQVSE